MTLTFIMLALLFAGALAWLSENRWQGSAKWLALIVLALLATVFTIFVISYDQPFDNLQVLTRVSWIHF